MCSSDLSIFNHHTRHDCAESRPSQSVKGPDGDVHRATGGVAESVHFAKDPPILKVRAREFDAQLREPRRNFVDERNARECDDKGKDRDEEDEGLHLLGERDYEEEGGDHHYGGAGGSHQDAMAYAVHYYIVAEEVCHVKSD